MFTDATIPWILRHYISKLLLQQTQYLEIIPDTKIRQYDGVNVCMYQVWDILICQILFVYSPGRVNIFWIFLHGMHIAYRLKFKIFPPEIDVRLFRGAFNKKIKSVDFFRTSQTPHPSSQSVENFRKFCSQKGSKTGKNAQKNTKNTLFWPGPFFKIVTHGMNIIVDGYIVCCVCS